MIFHVLKAIILISFNLLELKCIYVENVATIQSSHLEYSRIDRVLPSSFDNHECKKYDSIRYFNENEQINRSPSMLYTFPGSGNKWLEMLIEYASGIHIGSVYRDLYLIKNIFPGYGHCDKSVSLVLLHTSFHSHRDILSNKLPDVCLESNITRFHRVVMLIRNPFDAIWSEFQREHSDNRNHTGIIYHDNFDHSVWKRRSIRLAFSYKIMLASDYPAIEHSYGQGNYMYIRYEDLINHDLREGILDQLVSFLGLSSSPERIKCAFSLSDSPKVYRKVDPMAVTKSFAYDKQFRDVVCGIWKAVDPWVEKFNYTLPLPRMKFDCVT